MFGEEDLVKSHEARSKTITLVMLIAFSCILARLVFLQIYKGDQLYQYSLENRLREEIIRAPRGIIYSRDQKVLVNNYPRFDAIITRQYLTSPEATLNRLSEILKIPKTAIEKTIKKYSTQAAYRPIVVKKNITMEEVARIETENEQLPGISVDVIISREYADGVVGAHLLGYISEINNDQLAFYNKRDHMNYRLGDFIGQFGLEKQFDKYLRGSNGSEYVEVDALGRKRKYSNADMIFKDINNVTPVPGNNIILTIDSDMQRLAYEELSKAVGTTVAMNVQTGEILTMVSSPSFEPAEFSKGIQRDYWNSLVTNLNRPLRDRAIQEHYSPGSTFKPFTAMALLHDNIFDDKSVITCTGGVTFGSKTYHCWKKHGHGAVDLRKAIRESCNSYFQRAAIKLDIDSIAYFAKQFGLGTKTGVDLPREIGGLIPTEEWKMKKNGREWQKGETLSCAIGQSYVEVTMMQMAVAYAGIANGGKILRPYVVKEVVDQKGRTIRKGIPEIINEAKVDQTQLNVIREGLYQVVNAPHGTAFAHRGKGLQMVGKTGTSQVVGASADKVYQKCEEMPFDRRHHGLFIAFFPANDPKLVIATLVEHGCHGNSTAAPIVSKLAELYMKKYYPDMLASNIDLEIKNKSVLAVPVVKEAENEGDSVENPVGDE
jgi:penicillin-binding protein 2